MTGYEYKYEYEWGQEYCYPGSFVLKNKLDIRDAGTLSGAPNHLFEHLTDQGRAGKRLF